MNHIFAMVFAALLPAAVSGQVEVVVPDDAPEPVRFGAEEVRAALKSKGGANLRVILGEPGNELLRKVGAKRLELPAAPESYAISVLGGGTITVEGRDAAGVMYGALDLAEQISWAGGNDLAGQIRSRAKSPFLAIRGINAFLTAQGFDDPASWYWSDAFWRSYLDQLARSRHNFIDFHGPWDLTVEWPNGFSYFVWLPGFPDVGVGRERAAKNVARFRQIIRMAADRGVKIGFMNYKAEAPIGPWKPGRLESDVLFKQHRPRHAVAFLPAARLEQYTREAAAEFLKAVPELWMFGFRVGESGQSEDFYRNTYLEALKAVPPTLHVYTRTWLAAPAKIRALAGSMKNRFFIEPKFNGEQLGLPYQAALGGRDYAPSGSYEDYTNLPRNYSIIWQIRAHGTHRVFHWGWPEFARRTMRSCKFGGGSGFSMEPPNAYCPETDYLHNNPKIDHNFSQWKHQQDWFWYLVWGRTGFDPDVPDRVWLAEFERRFGKRAGGRVYQALVESSRIVPFVYSYHNQGLDHQHMAPELETGDYPYTYAAAAWKDGKLVPHPPSVKNFLGFGVLDRTAMADPVTYVEEHLSGKATGRMTPYEAGQYLAAAADKSERLIREAAGFDPSSAKEFACIRMDIEAAAALGRYYRGRILSATHLEFYNRTQHRPELTAAQRLFAEAVEEWKRLAEVGDTHYGFVPEQIRMRTYRFRWKDEGKRLDTIRAELGRMAAEFKKPPQGRIGHVPPRQVRPGRPIEIVVTAAQAGSSSYTSRSNSWLHMFYKKPGDLGYTEVPMQIRDKTESTWDARIPAAAAVPGVLEYYFESLGHPHYGGTLQYRAPYRVVVTEDQSKPVIEHRAPRGPVRGASVTVTALVKDNARVEAVSVYYKRMPSHFEWLKVRMKPTAAGTYSAVLPLTSEGILYYFEAVDEHGNAANHPDFLKQTPYYAINAWDPKQP